jgi:hypothetical protein
LLDFIHRSAITASVHLHMHVGGRGGRWVPRPTRLASSLLAVSNGASARKDYRNRGANRRAKRPSEILFMQDWILVLAPVSLVTYFLLFPDQFHHFMAWFGHLIR